jgi:hypothetical protein
MGEERNRGRKRDEEKRETKPIIVVLTSPSQYKCPLAEGEFKE